MSTTIAPAPTDVPDVGVARGTVLPHLDAVHDHLLWLTMDVDRAAALTAEVGLRAIGRLADGRADAGGRLELLRAAHGRLRDVPRTAPTDQTLGALTRVNRHVDGDLLRRVATAVSGLPLDVVAALHLTGRLGLDVDDVAAVLAVDTDDAARLRDRAVAATRSALDGTGPRAVDAAALLPALAAVPTPRPVLDLLATADDRAPRGRRPRHPAFSWVAAAAATVVAGGLLVGVVEQVVTTAQPAPVVVAAVPVAGLTGDGATAADGALAADAADVDDDASSDETERTTSATPADAADVDTDAPQQDVPLDTGRADAAPDDPTADDAVDDEQTEDDAVAEDEQTAPDDEPSPEPSDGGPLSDLLDPGDA